MIYYFTEPPWPHLQIPLIQQPNLRYVGWSFFWSDRRFCFTASVQFDQRFYKQDIAGRMLPCLQKLAYSQKQSENWRFKHHSCRNWSWKLWMDLEDVHMNIESRLTQRIGVKNSILVVAVMTKLQLILSTWRNWWHFRFIRAFTKLGLAAKNVNTIMPGFTHLLNQ